MNPIQFPQANKNLTKPEGWTDEQCGTLPVFTNGQQVISCWEVTPEDLERIKQTGKVWLSVFSGHTQPPVAVMTEEPFVENTYEVKP